MGNLGRNHGLGYALTPLQPDPFRRNGLQASAIVQAVGLRIPQNRIDIEKVMPQQLLDGMRFRSVCHLGVIFHAPHIENQPLGSQAALYPAEGVCRENGLAQVAFNFLNGTRAENNNIDVSRLRLDGQHAFQQQVAEQAAHDAGSPVLRKKAEESA